MKRLYPTLLATTLMASVFGLNGCGDGSSGSHGALTAPPADTKTTIAIGNKSDRTYVRAVLLDKNGHILKEQDIDCKASATNCMVYLHTQVTQSAILLVQDKQRRMIGAYAFPSSGLGSFNNVYPTNQSTGRYLADKLFRDHLSKENISFEEASQRALILFKNYTNTEGNNDPFTSLGDYYLEQTKDSSISENEFLEKLAKRLVNWEVAKPDELPKTKNQSSQSSLNKISLAFNALINNKSELISLANATTPTASCSPALKSFLSISEGLAKAIPTAGSAISGAIGVGTKACAGDPSKEIMSALTALQTTVTNTNIDLGKLASFTYDKEITDKNNDFLRVFQVANEYTNVYDDFVLKNGKLKVFFESKGGFNQGLAAGGETVKAILNTATVVNELVNLDKLGSLNSYFQALNNRCAALAPGRNENFLAVRSFCNSSIMSNVAFLGGAQSALLPVLKDVYETLALYESKGENLNNFITPTIVTTYAKGYDEVKTAFEKKQESIIKDIQTHVGVDGFKTGTFDLYAGLNDELKRNLVERACSQIGTSTKKLPNIVGWYSPSASSTTENYIVTECQLVYADLPDHIQLAKARYYYANQGANVNANNVANVLGVPVAKHYVDKLESINHKWSVEGNVKASPLFRSPFNQALNNQKGAGQTNGIVPMKDVKPSDYVLHHQQLSDFVATIPGENGTGYTWVSLMDRDRFRYVVLLRMLASTSQVDGYKTTSRQIAAGCVTYECRVETTNDEWLTFRRPGQTDYIVDVSLRPEGWYQLGPLQ